MFLGTDWVAPGTGAYVSDLLTKVTEANETEKAFGYEAILLLSRSILSGEGNTRSSLKLTGNKLEQHDFERILTDLSRMNDEIISRLF